MAGWIAQGPPGSVIEFPLRFGNSPIASLTYLLGYATELGEAKVQMVDVSPQGVAAVNDVMACCHTRVWTQNYFQVDGLRTDTARVTQSAVAVMLAGRTFMNGYAYTNVRGAKPGPSTTPLDHMWTQGPLGFGLPPHAKASLRVTLLCPRSPTCKFKIISVASC